MKEIKKLIFIKLPVEDGKELKEFETMIGHTYNAYLSEFNQEYVILSGLTEKGEKAYQDSIYKSMLAIGEDKEFAKAVAYEGEDAGMCLYFKKECFMEEQ